MLPREHRLTTSDDFRLASRRGRRAGTATLVVHLWIPEEPTGPARIGFVVSKAVGTAVVRNRVRRRLRHLAREHLATLPGSAVLVVRALPAAAGASYEALGRDLAHALRRVAS